ncbi:MAG: sigma-54 dependent transcriptional regulator [Proteobacteria bacterium]|nr:sigma-54 dependent transcriptional regulator [Pseudomonadota bacterium]
MKNTLYPAEPILVVDDEEAILLSVDTILQLAGMNNVLTCSDSRQALEIIQKYRPSVVLLDLNMPHFSGEAIHERLASLYPHIPVIIITGRIDAETAVERMKSGAFDYIVKPVDEKRLVETVKKSLQYKDLLQENQVVGEEAGKGLLQNPQAFAALITNSPKMLQIFGYAESVATTLQPLLICGETGTGKELMARAIHTVSGCPGEFVAVNVAGLDDNVFADTLFGHVKGAFTGAEEHRPGLIDKAAGGTLFLDEIGDLSSGSQIKLLRLLQEKEYMPLGQDSNRRSTARIIASTHVDLWDLQNRELFRQDLHYRLRTHKILLPPLRERREDIGLLVEHFATWSAETLHRQKPHIPRELTTMLESYRFPGNVRELQAMVFDAIARHKSGAISLAVFRHHIWQASKDEGRSCDGSERQGVPILFAEPLPTIKEAIRMLVEEAMQRAGGNQTTAASMLGISQQALSKRLKNREDL